MSQGRTHVASGRLGGPAFVHSDVVGTGGGRNSFRVSVACALIAVLAGITAIWAANDASWPDASTLVKVAFSDPIAPLAQSIDPSFDLGGGQEHYDGLYYYAIALDPLALGQAHELIDMAGYRYGRPMHGWLAGALSVGNRAAIPEALLVLSLIGLALGAFGASRICVMFGRTPWGGLVIAMSPGLLFATTVSTTETVGAALAIWLVLCWLRESPAWAIAVLSIVLSLHREQLVLVVLGILLYELVDRIRRRSRGRDAKRLAALLAGPVMLAGWIGYLHARLGTWPKPDDAGSLSVPPMGWIESFRVAYGSQNAGTFVDHQIGSTAPAYLVALAVLLLTALWAARRMRSPLDAILIVEVIIMATLGWRTLAFPHEMYRIPSLAILSALAVLLLPGRSLLIAEPSQSPDRAP